MATAKQPPIALEVENCVIGAALKGVDFFRIIVDSGVSSNDFFDLQNRAIFSQMERFGGGDIVTLSAAMPPDFAIILMQKGNKVATTVNLEKWCQTLREYTARRNALEEAYKIAIAARDEETKFITALDALAAETMTMAARIEKREVFTLTQKIRNFSEDLDAGISAGDPVRYSMPLLDAKIRHCRKEVHVLAAYPGGGKTNFALSVILNLIKNGESAAMFCQEMPFSRLLSRLIANYASVDYGEVLAAKEREKCRFAEDFLSKSEKKLMLCGAGEYQHSVSGIRAEILRHRAEYGISPAFVVVDYLQNMSPPDFLARSGDYQQIKYNVEGLRSLAHEFDFALLELSQFNRSKADEQPTMQSLRGASDIEAAATIITILRPSGGEFLHDRPREIIADCVKNRDGLQFKTTIQHLGYYCRFEGSRFFSNDCLSKI